MARICMLYKLCVCLTHAIEKKADLENAPRPRATETSDLVLMCSPNLSTSTASDSIMRSATWLAVAAAATSCRLAFLALWLPRHAHHGARRRPDLPTGDTNLFPPVIRRVR